jgi:hypothetical protein
MNTARFVIAAALACAAAACASKASTPSNDERMACVDKLELPSFPAIADSARVEAGVSAAVLLAKDGTVEKVTMGPTTGLEYAAKLFYPAVEKAMKASKFQASCGGNTVLLAFDFPFPLRSESGETIQTVRFKTPNRFEIALTPAPERFYDVNR